MSSAQRVRVFVGLKIVREIAQELWQLARPLERFPVRVIAVADIHLTLVPPWLETSVPEAMGKLRNTIIGAKPFSLTFERLSYGPTLKRPRLLWAECGASDQLMNLRAALLKAYGQKDERAFRPHVTLARIKKGGRAIARELPMDQTLSLAQQVQSVELFQSPARGESGYLVLASLSLGPKPKLPQAQL
jgi:2'-5' RNA ligase